MAIKTKKPEKAPMECRDCEQRQTRKDKVRVSDLISKAIEGFEKRIEEADFKMTVGDYLKLVQMEKEYEQEGVKEIRVTWVEPPAQSLTER
jgi:hypothetical protein